MVFSDTVTNLSNGRRNQVAQIQLSVKSRPEPSSIFYLLENLEGTISRGSIRMDDDPGLWSRRGWTFQEYQLSPRMLIFDKHYLYFDCRDGEKDESGGIRNHWETNRALFKIKGSDSNPSLGYIDHHAEWYSIIGNSYSGRHFTKQSDRLPALIGFATEWEDMINAKECKDMIHKGGTRDRYVAGLWKDDMPRGLLWRSQSQSTTSRPLDYAAPSWSWASIIGEVYWPWEMEPNRQGPSYKKESKKFQRFGTSETQYHSKRIDIPGTDPYSLVTSGSITVSAFLQKMRLNPPSPNHDQGSLEFFDRNGSQSCGNSLQPVLENTPTIISIDVPSEFANARNVWCFLVASREASGESSRKNYAGLLLLSTDGNAKCFTRFGYFEIVWNLDKDRKIFDYLEEREIVII